MTTIVGINAKEGEEGIILASDLTMTSTQWDAVGPDVAYRTQKKSITEKIHQDNKKEFALCMSGLIDKDWINFLSAVKRGKIDVKKAVKKGFFQEFKDLHEKRWDGYGPNLEQMNSLLIATRFEGSPNLYTCWPLGKIEERGWTSIGSGSSYALNFLKNSAEKIPHYTSIKDGIDLAVKSLDKASQDIYTGGLDLVVVTKEKIHSLGNIIERELEKSKENYMKKIKSEF